MLNEHVNEQRPVALDAVLYNYNHSVFSIIRLHGRAVRNLVFEVQRRFAAGASLKEEDEFQAGAIAKDQGDRVLLSTSAFAHPDCRDHTPNSNFESKTSHHHVRGHVCTEDGGAELEAPRISRCVDDTNARCGDFANPRG